jgi:hypothetical protein
MKAPSNLCAGCSQFVCEVAIPRKRGEGGPAWICWSCYDIVCAFAGAAAELSSVEAMDETELVLAALPELYYAR